jgi:hypothetical protein
MPIVVVGGSGRNVGKTSLMCGLIAALPEFGWTAVKISSHAHDEREAVWEETSAGQGTDTGRYLAAGARRAFLMAGLDGDFPIAAIQAALGSHANAVFESNRIVNALEPDLCIGVMGRSGIEMKPSFARFLDRADALVMTADRDLGGLKLPSSVKIFRMAQLDRISTEMIEWIRTGLSQ